ncbi:MAG: cell division protein FtsQ/DivIB [Chitinophagales bacterium]
MNQGKRPDGGPILAIVLGLVALCAFYFFLRSSLFFIDRITVTGNVVVDKKEILALSGIQIGQNIFDIDPAASEKAIGIVPRIKRVEVSRKIPRQVLIRVAERKPWAMVVNKKGYIVIDGEGVCLGSKTTIVDDPGVPIITLEDQPGVLREGERLSASIKNVRKVVDALPEELRPIVSEYHCTKNGQVFLYTIEGTEVRLGGLDRLAEKMQLLDQVVDMNKDESNTGLQYIDLRYKGQPVICYR